MGRCRRFRHAGCGYRPIHLGHRDGIDVRWREPDGPAGGYRLECGRLRLRYGRGQLHRQRVNAAGWGANLRHLHQHRWGIVGRLHRQSSNRNRCLGAGGDAEDHLPKRHAGRRCHHSFRSDGCGLGLHHRRRYRDHRPGVRHQCVRRRQWGDQRYLVPGGCGHRHQPNRHPDNRVGQCLGRSNC